MTPRIVPIALSALLLVGSGSLLAEERPPESKKQI
jgi:hypothetical protein